MTLSQELQWRGFVNQTTLKDIKQLDSEPTTFYWGVDPSSDSMQVGNLAAAMMVRHFIQHGHKAVLLVGGATGMIGDPDGKDEERQLKSLDEIAKNKAVITTQYKQIFAGQDFTIVDNYDWFKDIGYLQFLRDVGKHFSMTQLLQRDFVQSRIGEGGKGISYAEFSYSLIQGYDFLHLFRTHGVTLQVCGADQWGNSLSGVELVRKLDGKEAHVYSTPLIINKATGKKFGKSEAGAVWLAPQKTSVYDFYQFWLNADDAGVIDYLKIFTMLDKSAIKDAAAKTAANPAQRFAQKLLAYEVTKIVHGEDEALKVAAITDVLFGKKAVHDLETEARELLKGTIPSVTDYDHKQTVVELLLGAGLVASQSEGQRLVSQGAVSVNGQKITADTRIHQNIALIKKGKNTFLLVVG